MARTNGAYTRPSNSFSNPVTGTAISSTHADATFDDFETALDTINIRDDKFSLLDNGDTTKVAAFDVSGVTTGTTRTLTVPNASTTIVGHDATQTLTNKTLALGSNTVSGTIAQFNTAVTDADFATLAGTETLTNKTVALGSNTVSGTIAQFNTAVTDADFATLAGTETLTNKTVNLANNTVTGTLAEFNTAVSDANLASIAGSETLTNKTLTAPTINAGTLTGVLDAGGATSFEIPNDAAPTVNADGEIAVDTTVTDFSHGIIKYYSGEELVVLSLPVAQFSAPTNGAVPTYNSTADEFQLSVPAGAGDVVGPASSTDNAIVRFDGTTGKSIQNSGVTVSDTNQIGLAADNTGINDNSGNEQVRYRTTASAVNYVEQTNSATGNPITIAAAGDDTNIGLTINGKGTGGVNIEGTATNDSAGAGYVGELIESELLEGSAVSLTTATTTNVTSISLTAGDWDVWGNVALANPGTTTITAFLSTINTTSATLPTKPGKGAYAQVNVSYTAGANQVQLVGQRRISINSTTTVYLITNVSFATSTLTAFGYLGARRVR
jgi:hypothetical protein